MLMFWRIRYLDTHDKLFRNRDLWIDTNDLDPITKAAVETIQALQDVGRGREIVRYRRLFQEKDATDKEWRILWFEQGGKGSFFISDYFEDEAGRELTNKRMAVVVTGDPEAECLPPGTTQNDIDYCLAEKRPIDLTLVSLSSEQLSVLGYFCREFSELSRSAFLKDGPGSLNGPWSDGRFRVTTAVSDEEIRSFVTIFRRLYMDGEPANFVTAVSVFSESLKGNPLANWVQGIATKYAEELEEEPRSSFAMGKGSLSFSRKRLIDVFLYTQYFHQPLGKNKHRAKQFQDCLTAVCGDRAALTWLFLTEIWHCAIHFSNAGGVVAEFYDSYCKCHSIKGGVLTSVRDDHPGLGVLEKKEVQEAKILREKAEELAKALWESEGRPEGGHVPFINVALDRLMAATRAFSKEK